MSTCSPCAGCKFLRRKCTADCVFAPYFPPDQPHKFVNVHKIFGASNIAKLLNELPPHQRQDAVNSLAYEAEARVKDPVYGCVGAISLLQQRIAHLQAELAVARSELARCVAAAGVAPGLYPSVLQQQEYITSPRIPVQPNDQLHASSFQLVPRSAESAASSLSVSLMQFKAEPS